MLVEKLKDEEEVIRQIIIRINDCKILFRKKYIEMEKIILRFMATTTEHHGIGFIFNLINLLYS